MNSKLNPLNEVEASTPTSIIQNELTAIIDRVEELSRYLELKAESVLMPEESLLDSHDGEEAVYKNMPTLFSNQMQRINGINLLLGRLSSIIMRINI